MALIFSVLLAPSVANFMQSKFNSVTAMGGSISGFLNNVLGKEVMNATLSDITEGVLSKAGVSGFIISIILSFKGDSSIPQDTKVCDIIGPTFAYYVVIIIAVIALFIIFKIIFFIISEIIKKSYENKTIKRFDRTLGCALGLVNGIINLEFIIMVISILPIPFFQGIYADIQSGGFTKLIESTNLFGLIVNSISVNSIIDLVKSIIRGNLTFL